MLITHEAPLDMMYTTQMYTDYDYCLVHLLEKSEEYCEFFFEANKNKRHIIMDCSLYELGSAFDSKKYAYWIEKIQPTEYIVPDVWQNYEENLKSFEKFNQEYKNLPGKKMGVLQGKTSQQLLDAYKFFEQKADKICISFGYDYYLEIFKKLIPGKFIEDDENSYKKIGPLSFCSGRIFLINLLMTFNILNDKKPHHLLGCGSPSEFSFYKNFNFIESIDTSHPILMGLEGKRYTDLNINFYKPTFKIDDIFFEETKDEQVSAVLDNIKYFKLNYDNKTYI